jgi:hypothetical protein
VHPTLLPSSYATAATKSITCRVWLWRRSLRASGSARRVLLNRLKSVSLYFLSLSFCWLSITSTLAAVCAGGRGGKRGKASSSGSGGGGGGRRGTKRKSDSVYTEIDEDEEDEAVEAEEEAGDEASAEDDAEEVDDTVCAICNGGSSKGDNLILLCDGCSTCALSPLLL